MNMATMVGYGQVDQPIIVDVGHASIAGLRPVVGLEQSPVVVAGPIPDATADNGFDDNGFGHFVFFQVLSARCMISPSHRPRGTPQRSSSSPPPIMMAFSSSDTDAARAASTVNP